MEEQEVQNPGFSGKIQPIMHLPNATAALVMGILSIVCFCCIISGLIGFTLGILSVVLGHKAIIEYHANPARYTEVSYKNAKAGKLCGIIGISLGSIWIIGLLIYLSIIGWVLGTALSAIPWDLFSNQ